MKWKTTEFAPVSLPFVDTINKAEITDGNGSRVQVALKGVRAVFHRPHPQKEANKGAIKSVRRFLEAAGVRP